MAVRWIGSRETPPRRREFGIVPHKQKQMKILITGGAGFLGTHLTQHFLAQNHEVIVASRDEAKHWKLKQVCGNSPKLHTHIWNAADSSPLNVAGILHATAPDVVILAHAMKRIDVCEEQPEQAISTNVLGIQYLLQYIKHLKPKNLTNVVLISTDKAANPISVYGTTKLLAEQLVRRAEDDQEYHTTNFAVVRYGNVLESTGSVIPAIRGQIERGQPLQLTDPDMTRFIFTVREAVDMVQYMIDNDESGLWIPGNIPSMYIGDLFKLFSEKCNVPIERSRPRSFPEKAHEVLNTEHEQIQWVSRKNHPLPIREPYQELLLGHATHTISSENVVLSKQQLKELLEKEKLL